jgi:hypothetical protein
MQGKKLGKEAFPRVYDINPKFTLMMIAESVPDLDLSDRILSAYSLASPKLDRKRHPRVTRSHLRSPILIIMRRAFVVQLGPETGWRKADSKGGLRKLIPPRSCDSARQGTAEVSRTAF